MTQRIKLLQRLFTAMFVCLLLVTLLFPFSARAETYSGHLNITGSFQNRQFSLTPSDSQLMDLKDIVPGDQWKGKITIHNSCSSTIEFSLYSIESQLKDNALFDALTLELSLDGNKIYSGSYNVGKKPPYMDYVKVGPGKDATLDVTVTLPEKVGNEIQGKSMKSIWTFDARHPDVVEVTSTTPTANVTPAKQENIQTGYDLTQSNSSEIAWAIFSLLSLLAVFITYMRIREHKKNINKK